MKSERMEAEGVVAQPGNAPSLDEDCCDTCGSLVIELSDLYRLAEAEQPELSITILPEIGCQVT